VRCHRNNGRLKKGGMSVQSQKGNEITKERSIGEESFLGGRMERPILLLEATLNSQREIPGTERESTEKRERQNGRWLI